MQQKREAGAEGRPVDRQAIHAAEQDRADEHGVEAGRRDHVGDLRGAISARTASPAGGQRTPATNAATAPPAVSAPLPTNIPTRIAAQIGRAATSGRYSDDLIFAARAREGGDEVPVAPEIHRGQGRHPLSFGPALGSVAGPRSRRPMRGVRALSIGARGSVAGTELSRGRALGRCRTRPGRRLLSLLVVVAVGAGLGLW